MAESNPNSFNCSAKKDIANKPFKIGDPTNYFEDPVVCSGFIAVSYTHLTLPTTPYV